MRLLLLIVALLVVAPSTAQVPPTPDHIGAATPEEVWARYLTCPAGLTPCVADLTPPHLLEELAPRLLAAATGAVAAGVMAPEGFAALDVVLTRHHVDRKAKMPSGPDAMDRWVNRALAPVKDSAQLARDLVEWADMHIATPTPRDRLPTGELRELLTRGDIASASADFLIEGVRRPQAVYFVRVSKRWYLDNPYQLR